MPEEPPIRVELQRLGLQAEELGQTVQALQAHQKSSQQLQLEAQGQLGSVLAAIEACLKSLLQAE